MRPMPDRALGAPAALVAAAAVYLIAHLLVRIAAPGGVELDEAEQLLLSQWLQGGYSPQPPLYTWLQIIVFQALGPSVLALALLRTLLLFALFALFYQAARRTLSEERLAVLAALSLLFIVQIVWELQRENTHSLLVLTIAAAQFLLVLKMLERRSLGLYLAAGLLAGLGLLAKYNYGVFLAATGLALLTRPGGRALIVDRRVFAATAVALLVLLPHLLWLADQAATVSDSLTDKLDARSQTGPLLALGRLALTIASYLSPLWLVYLLVFPEGYRRILRGRPAVTISFPFATYFAVVLAILIILVLALDADRFRERWMHPLLFLFPIWYLAHVDAGNLSPGRERLLRALAAAVAVAMLAVMGFRSFVAPHTGPYSRIDQPLAEVAEAIRVTGLPTDQMLAAHYHLAGSLRLHFPDSRIHAPRSDLVIPGPTEGPVLLVWDAARSDSAPADLLAYAARHRRLPDDLGRADPVPIAVPYAGAVGGQLRLALLALP